jgi:uncharacterized membrane protein YkoI
MLRSRVFPLALAAGMALAGTGAACAGNGDGEMSPQKEIDAVLGAKTSMSQAIAPAEQATGGKAFSAGIDDKDGVLTYEVKTAKTGALQMVRVDINAGNVVKVTPIDAKADEEEQGD